MTVHDQAAKARDRFMRAGIPAREAALDARLLAQFVLGWSSARYVTALAEPWPAGLAERYETLVCRRERREPLAYITGTREFWGLSFTVTPAVLIPRQETELIVETALELFPDRRGAIRVADVGTGSGCLAVALAHEFANVRVLATDLSPAALAVATENVDRLGAGPRVTLAKLDLLSGENGRFDLVVSNPPYVPGRDREALQPEVRDSEPAAALFGGSDGLEVIRRLVDEMPDRVSEGGYLIFEFGAGQADAVTRLISMSPGFKMVGLRRDLQNIPRVAIAGKR